ncbi:unnamed protein product [Owenia fusiformis]|uniref:Uncharacterized protein n=1 Tax=Owenia fusiformis TaxID=6347 RepID=A0A8J1U401_OWEFU|nr:unnamed protein product [Owenia fusiformis]
MAAIISTISIGITIAAAFTDVLGVCVPLILPGVLTGDQGRVVTGFQVHGGNVNLDVVLGGIVNFDVVLGGNVNIGRRVVTSGGNVKRPFVVVCTGSVNFVVVPVNAGVDSVPGVGIGFTYVKQSSL